MYLVRRGGEEIEEHKRGWRMPVSSYRNEYREWRVGTLWLTQLKSER